MASSEVQDPPVVLGQRPTSSQVLKGVFSRLTDAAWSLSRRLVDMVQGHGSLSQSPACIMGVQYGQPLQAAEGDGDAAGQLDALTQQDRDGLLLDFCSRVWCTYRSGFPPLGGSGLTSDVGWGCTIRSGQMMMAEALSRHMLGRHWRRTDLGSAAPGHGGPKHAQSLHHLLSHFLDDPDAPLSIHAICAASQAHGLVPGKWLGPWALCRALARLVNSSLGLGLALHVVCDPGGGAPTLHPASLLAKLGGSTQQQPGPADGPDGQAADSLGGPTGSAVRPESTANGHADGDTPSQPSPPSGLVLLLPLTLGVGKANPLYFPQLLRVLSFPQSIGIVGGRPAASLFFLGSQDDSLLYLDPHLAQAAAPLPAGLPSYFCNVVRLMPIASIDPSLAIGFYCRDAGELQDLVLRLDALAKEHRNAPIVTVAAPASAGSMGQEAMGSHDNMQLARPLTAENRGGGGSACDLESWEVL